jgi:glycogen debranching enzyme
MISLPGLLLTTRRFREAARILSLFAQYVDQGMIPNVFRRLHQRAQVQHG